MPEIDGQLSFRPLSEDDLSRMQKWLNTPHVFQWYLEPYTLEQVREHYLPRIDGRELSPGFIVELGGQPVGFIQRYRLEDWPEWAEANRHAVPDQDGVIGIDYLVGDPDLVGKGLGTRIIAEFCASIFSEPDVKAISSDPQTANLASCKVLENNGFQAIWQGKLKSDDPSDAGPSTIYLLSREKWVARSSR